MAIPKKQRSIVSRPTTQKKVATIRGLTTALCLTSLSFVCTQVFADAPLRGNPVDALPSVQSPPSTSPIRQPLTLPQPAVQSALQARLEQQVKVQSFDVSGSRSIPFSDISGLLTPLSGRTLSVAQLIQEVNQITVLYQQAGYPLSFAVLQEQDFAQGKVKITVVEGYIGTLTLQGDAGATEPRIRRIAQAMLEEKPLTQRTLERTMNLLRTIPGLQFKPDLKLATRTDGKSELILDLQHQNVSVNASLAEIGSSTQAMLQLSANSLTPLGEKLTITGALPTTSEDVKYIAGNLSIPLGGNGLTLDIDGYHYHSHPKDNQLERLGWSRTVINERVGAAISYPFLLNNRQNLKGHAGFYVSRSSDNYARDADQAWIAQTTDLRVLKAELEYRDASLQQSRELRLGVYRGIDGMGARKDLSTYIRPTGQSAVDLNFTRWTANFKQTLVLPQQFGLSVSGAGQLSNNALPSSEQISFGAWRHGYGYPQGEIAGDKGLGVTLELNRRFQLNNNWLNSIQAYIAHDWARTWQQQAELSIEPTSRRLRSAAVGLRFSNNKHYLIDVNVAKPLGPLPTNERKRHLRYNTNLLFYHNAL
ncbi:ShlB/FhaC/HecB family hemolysin secretion/activation protein [Alcaligenes endophyticus]|uniref:ShlB/FhaC/HecB family hemolysin secretion/activation protein n=1 Tax=Alcaligenes endophyticus TaxID=1929088 RepID=A0ABT8EHC1_9BURK|nr:POTRA domain-containing protein [Alcaligenes endophyticus]MCX5589646.1 ShlB/FhaC/HecB family hemolysin secretion/activation protein [Alcaligenes endophyticus]MDN4120690.1 ShlB/FhaC/HecB family hemolysin secretion/activation protein [Alcaligenes endophyticus]